MLSGFSKFFNYGLMAVTGISILVNPVFMDMRNGPPKYIKNPKTMALYFKKEQYCHAWWVDTDTCLHWNTEYTKAQYYEIKDEIPLSEAIEESSEMGKP